MANEKVWTVGELLAWTTGFLKEHGADSPRLDAEVLLAHVRGCRRIELYTAFAETPDEATRARFRDLVRERSRGAPVAYLVGGREFYSLPFRVTPDVLIPRPETEHLVIRLLDLAGARGCKASPAASSGESGGADANQAQPRIADVGSGSGVIAVCAAKHLPRATVSAIDTSAAALEVAKVNAQTHGVDDRVEFFVSDLFANVPSGRPYDFIVSNPPYVTSQEWETLARDVRDHEPRAALVAGPRGTEVIERLLDQAHERLAVGGWLLTEISPMLETAVRQLVERHGGYELGATVKDLASQARVIQARRRD